MKGKKYIPKTLAVWLNAVIYAALAGAMMHLLLHYSAFVARFHDMSLFNGGWASFASYFDRPGALVLYCGRFLTQFCLYPAVAAVLLVSVLGLIVLLVRKSLVKDSRYGVLAALPSLFLFLFVMGIGYEVLTARADAQIFTQPLGILSSVALLLLLQKISSLRNPWLSVLCIFAAVTAGYVLTGAFALVAALTFACWTLFHDTRGKRAALLLTALLSAALVPPLCHLLIYERTVPEYIWFVGLPYLDYAGNPLQLWKLGASAALLPLLALPRFEGGRPVHFYHAALSALVAAAAISSVYILPERRALFHRQMEAERAIGEGDWNKVLSITATQGVTNDVLAAYRNCALYALGRLPQDCWRYSFNTVPINSGKTVYSSSRVAGPGIFYHSGLVNYASRWASEINLYGEYSVERVKYLAKAALLNGEPELARKYIRTVGKTTLDRAWARKYLAYADDPSLMDSDDEFRRLKPLRDYEEKGWYPSYVAAYDVLLFYSFVKGNSPEMLEWNLASALLTKGGDFFEEVYPAYAATHDPVPDGIAQAHEFFRTLVFDSSASSNPDNYVFFYYNTTVLRPN